MHAVHVARERSFVAAEGRVVDGQYAAAGESVDAIDGVDVVVVAAAADCQCGRGGGGGAGG